MRNTRRPGGARWDREIGFDTPIQPRDPIAAAAAKYCKILHSNTDAESACKSGGTCVGCRETVEAIVRAYHAAALKE